MKRPSQNTSKRISLYLTLMVSFIPNRAVHTSGERQDLPPLGWGHCHSTILASAAFHAWPMIPEPFCMLFDSSRVGFTRPGLIFWNRCSEQMLSPEMTSYIGITF